MGDNIEHWFLIESVLVNLSAGGLESNVTSVEIDIAGQRISEEDMNTLCLQQMEILEKLRIDASLMFGDLKGFII